MTTDEMQDINSLVLQQGFFRSKQLFSLIIEKIDENFDRFVKNYVKGEETIPIYGINLMADFGEIEPINLRKSQWYSSADFTVSR